MNVQNQFIYTPYSLDEPNPEIAQLAQANWQANTPAMNSDDRYEIMSALHENLAAFADATLKAGDRAVSVNGDCCAAIGMLAGLQRAGIDPMLIWFDAHGDFNTPETSPSGYIAGMSLAIVVGRGDQQLMERIGAKPLPEAQSILIGGRDLDALEAAALVSSKVQHVHDVDDLLKLDLGDRPIYVHFDTDILNPAEAPALIFPTEGGPSTTALQAVMQHLANTGKVVAVSMTVWDVAKDTDKTTQAACMACLEALVA